MMSDSAQALSWMENCFLNNAFSQVDWLQTFRQKQFDAFLQRGFPTKDEESWKYTDVSHLSSLALKPSPLLPPLSKQAHFSADAIRLIFKNGHYVGMQGAALPDGLLMGALSEYLEKDELISSHLLKEYDAKQFPFALLNSALITDGLFLRISKGCEITQPIHLVYLSETQQALVACPRNIILLEEGAKAHIIEEYHAKNAGHYLTNPVTTIVTEANAMLHYYKIQCEALNAIHIGNTFLEQKKGSSVNIFFFSRGAELQREDLTISHRETGTETHAYGYYFLNHDGQQIDHHLQMHHVATHGQSSMLYKGILQKKSRATFNGKVVVAKEAKHIMAHQANHHLLLSKEAEANSKPALEIYADEVQCQHGATTGQLDDDAIFYLCSRGINKGDAIQLLTRAFADEIFNKINHAVIKNHIESFMGNNR